MKDSNNEKIIYVYADFDPYDKALVGRLYVSLVKGKEFFSFEYDDGWLECSQVALDPDLQLYKGRQYLHDDKINFGIFADSSPDRWGRTLMKRAEETKARKQNEKPHTLQESDFLLGVFDESRMGGLRYKLNPDGDFLSNDKTFATPPWTSLRELEQKSIEFETNSMGNNKWIGMLLAPGSSLGGARPKASVVAPDGSLWIAKFPSKNDDIDVGAWEMVVHNLAKLCRLNVPEASTEKFSKLGTTFLVKRFDRDGSKRIHFASAMTLLGKKDGASSSDGSSYLDIVSALRSNGSRPKADTEELWRRIVFSMAVSNTDDHLRNHGFILTQTGWELSPMYDINPDIFGRYLSLSVDGQSSLIDFDLAIEAAPQYGIKKDDAKEYASEVKNIVKNNWEQIAHRQGISRNEIERMRPAFEAK